MDVDGLVAVRAGGELVWRVGGDDEDLAGRPVSCSVPIVNVAEPRRMRKVSA
jgi:hypothetical protein